jgi:3-phenylpropionate/trans-cinnamate dioxygenase ferredoxin reductase subunit
MSDNSLERVVIIGAGHGGVQTAFSLRQEGYEGEIRIVDPEDHLPYHKPPLSKAFLKSEDAKPQLLRAEALFAKADVKRIPGRVCKIDTGRSRVVLADGAEIGFSELVIATGARPRIPPVPGCELEGVHVLRSLSDAVRLRDAARSAERTVIIGAGFIGLELAHCLRGLGKRVAVAEREDNVLTRSLAATVSNHIREQAGLAGLDIHLGRGLLRIEGNGRAEAVVVDAEDRIPADLVVLGVGVVPNTELAADAGLRVDNGILVDENLRTSVPDIYAIGDVASFPQSGAKEFVRIESVQNATDQAKAVAKSITGQAEPYDKVPWFWSDMGPDRYQMVGLHAGADAEVLDGDVAEGAFSVYFFHQGKLVAVHSVNRPQDHILARKLLANKLDILADDVSSGQENLRRLAAV